MPFAAALSEHPITAYAVGEACGEVLEQIGPHPDLVLVFTTLAHAGALEDVVGAVEAVLHPSVAVAAASASVIGTGREVEGGPAVSLWAGRWGPVLPIRVAAGGGITTAGLPTAGAPAGTPAGSPAAGGPASDLSTGVPFSPTALLLVGDPYSVRATELLAVVAGRYPGLPVVGGMAAGARGPGGTRLALDNKVHTTGAVGALLGPGVDVVSVVSQGCRPIGRPYVVTAGVGEIVRELAGRPALGRLEQLAASLTPAEIRSINNGGLYLGRVLDERKADFGPGDFVVRPVLGGDRQTGAIAVSTEMAGSDVVSMGVVGPEMAGSQVGASDVVEVGTTVQFHLRDGVGAHEDLDGLLSRAAPRAEAEAAWLFTCSGRGRRLFGVDNHDAGLLAERVGRVPTIGFLADGELGPAAGRNDLRSSSASVLLLREHRSGAR